MERRAKHQMVHTISHEFSLLWFQNGSKTKICYWFSSWRHIICII